MIDSGSQPIDDRERWNRLTDKQRACLDLLIEHNTSKEIARLLDISKHSVDQRLTNARDALGAGDRNELAFIYRRLLETCDRMTYDAVGVPSATQLMRSRFPDGDPPNLMDLQRSPLALEKSPGESLPPRDLLRPDYKAMQRIAIVAAGFIIVIIAVAGGLGIGQALTQLVSR